MVPTTEEFRWVRPSGLYDQRFLPRMDSRHSCQARNTQDSILSIRCFCCFSQPFSLEIHA
uniref:Uncharacterized protein n=1 Tax=Picea sitchensis TaxID=3332 RepID=A9P0I6_PICSI|nr:unknown [Picea sitchensis]